MPSAPHRLPSLRDRRAPTRALACLAASLAVVNAAFWLWPSVDLGPELPSEAAPRETLVLQMVEVTRQPPPPANLPPAPPPPVVVTDAPPVEVPDERVVDEIVREFDVPTLAPPTRRAAPQPARPAPSPPGPPAPPAPPAPAGPPPAADRIVEQPERSPRMRGQALPVYPRSARRSGFKGRARVKVLVNANGRVTDAEIVERTTFEGGRETPVGAFPPEFDAAILDAARRHLFTAARDGGERVRAHTMLSISLDPPD